MHYNKNDKNIKKSWTPTAFELINIDLKYIKMFCLIMG